MKLLRIKMFDNSTFVMPSESWQKAFDIKYGEDREGAIEAFKEVTRDHFNNKTIPTKFSTDEAWERPYANHADLGQDVMYVYIRTALLAVVMEEMAREEEEKTGKKAVHSRVVAIGPEVITEYTGQGKRRITPEETFGSS